MSAWSSKRTTTRRLRPQRLWMSHRQAYYPRAWPWLLPATVGGYVAGMLASLVNEWLVLPVAMLVALNGIAVGLWLIPRRWRRKHPVLSREQLVEVRRRGAPMN
jgi:membrane protein YdbS with pleckstrin-like domain